MGGSFYDSLIVFLSQLAKVQSPQTGSVSFFLSSDAMKEDSLHAK